MECRPQLGSVLISSIPVPYVKIHSYNPYQLSASQEDLGRGEPEKHQEGDDSLQAEDFSIPTERGLVMDPQIAVWLSCGLLYSGFVQKRMY